jgi:hypothetical protein
MSKNEEEIINRVAQSKLVTFNLEDFYPAGRRVLLDIQPWLHQGIVLREKEFRSSIANHDWEQYKDAFVALTCSTDAIVPGWAYMLIMTKLQPTSKKVVIGDLEQLETSIYQSVIADIDVSEYEGLPVIIKGCTKKPVPPNAYLWITAKLQTVAKSVMYGEACSSVPLFKK